MDSILRAIREPPDDVQFSRMTRAKPAPFVADTAFAVSGLWRNWCVPDEGFPMPRNPKDRASAFYLDALSRLGLKPVPAKGPTTVVVIDRIKRPSEN